MKKTASLPLAFAITLAAAGAAQAACEVTLADDIQPLFDINCVACHQDAAPGEGLSLQAGSTIANTVDVASHQVSEMPRIAPGDLENSYLYHKLAGTHAEVGGSGMQMPFGGQLAEADLAKVANWITECGAAE